MNNKYLTHDELQHIEHANKILLAHLEVVKTVVNESEALLNNYVPILATYINSIADVRKVLGTEVAHVVNSTRQISIVTSNTQHIIDFVQAVRKLNEILTPELVDKLNRLGNKE